MWQIIFWTSLFAILYIYIGYPLYIGIKAHLKSPLTDINSTLEPDSWPAICVLVPCYNESAHISNKIESILSADYPVDKRSIIIISDGSNDHTEVEVSKYTDVQLITYHPNLGKPTAIARGLANTTAPIIILTDARQLVDRSALKSLVKRLMSPNIGAVSGNLVISKGDNTSPDHQLGLYWRYEKQIRLWESRASSVPGVSGALYAIRRRDIPQIPKDTILDDFEIPLGIIYQGLKCVIETDAIVYENTPVETNHEFRRKVRTLTGNFQSFERHTWLFSPKQNPIWFEFISHKCSRLASPYLFLLLLISSFFLYNHLFYRTILMFQLLFYSVALAAHISPTVRTYKVPSIIYFFCRLNFAAIIALFNYWNKNYDVKWKRP